MGLDYEYPEDGSKSCSKEPLKVKLDGRHVGEIRKVEKGFQYYPKDSKNGGDIFDSVSRVQDSLQKSQPAKKDREPAAAVNDKAEVEQLNEQLKKSKADLKTVNGSLDRAKTLLSATFDLLGLQKDSETVLNLLEEMVNYDDADCDGHSLAEDIQELMESME
jgi:hypothetical protein